MSAPPPVSPARRHGAPVTPPPEEMNWSDYQAWIDGLREAGYELTTHSLAPCQK